MIDLALLIWAVAAAAIANAMYIAALLAVRLKKSSPPDPPVGEQEDFRDLPSLTIVRPLRGLEDGAEGLVAVAEEGAMPFGKGMLWKIEKAGAPTSYVLGTMHIADPGDHTNILFSSGTTAEPKAIPWSHITPIKAGTNMKRSGVITARMP